MVGGLSGAHSPGPVTRNPSPAAVTPDVLTNDSPSECYTSFFFFLLTLVPKNKLNFVPSYIFCTGAEVENL